MDYSKKSFVELKQLLRDRYLGTTGKKADLIQRLQENDIKIKEEAKRFKVFIKTLTGSCYTIYTEPIATILELKGQIEEKMNCPIDKQLLYFLCRDKPNLGDITYQDGTTAKRTSDEDTLSSLGVHNESFFNLHIRLISSK